MPYFSAYSLFFMAAIQLLCPHPASKLGDAARDAAAGSRVRADQKRKMSERSELFSFPALILLTAGIRRAASAVAFLCLLFFGEAKKVSGRRATPG
jgi:hypothetical protein